MSKEHALPSHKNHGRAPFPALAFRQVHHRFRSRKLGEQVLSAQPAVASDSDSEDAFADPTPVQIARRQARDAAYNAKSKRKAEKKEKEENKGKDKGKKKGEPGNKRKKKGEKRNITEDEAARQGLTWRAERAVVNQLTTWVWGVDCPEQIVISEPQSTQPMPEMDEERIALQFFDTPRRLQLFAI